MSHAAGRAVHYPPLAADHHPVGLPRAAQQQCGDRVLGPREPQLVKREQRHISLLPHIQPADIIAAKAASRPSGRPPDDGIVRHCLGRVAQAAKQHGLAHFLGKI
jgi:hypothetical protein